MKNTRDYNFRVTTIEAGQRAKYGDSYYSFEIENLSEIDYSEIVVKQFCTNFVRLARFSKEERDKQISNQSFAFGNYFSPYYTEFKKVGERKFIYKVVEPSTH